MIINPHFHSSREYMLRCKLMLLSYLTYHGIQNCFFCDIVVLIYVSCYTCRPVKWLGGNAYRMPR
ncbi:hypothetical protein L873DRAFT_1801169 [Choiromyces venosus 120613-1]|uniref:Uncharacterized protein n=1 Tax=Choiromyces venosus 120613-1 TaxID=1336337 RepID=A0A3N4K0P7_9PEZI|nr:hypothetical protein L873DRAFT_1801169 [Choiromyces venosus 120613-1]